MAKKKPEVKKDDKKPENSFDHDSFVYWKSQIQAAEKWRREWIEKGESIVRRYRDEDRSDFSYVSRYNILYANTETLLPVLYAAPPRAEVSARDPKVISHRKAGQVVEEAINYYIDTGGLHDAALDATKDFLLAGLGQIRVRYCPVTDYEDVVKDDVTESVESVVFEELKFEYVHWKDFIFPKCSSPDELPWIAFRTFLAYEEAQELLGSKADLLNYTIVKVDDRYKGGSEKNAIKKAEVFEIWDKRNREQIFYADTPHAALLEINDDPLELVDFFPTPNPLRSITTSNTMLPVPFYSQYKDQANELDEVTSRIGALVENMKRRGFYDGSVKELGNLSNLNDNEFFPITNWQEFSTKGGMQGAIAFEDITVYAQVLTILVERSNALLQEIYQIIGISDIMRAQTDPRETLGAQQMKGKYGTIRVSTNQRKVANFLRDVLAIAGEIIINQFEPETVAIITNRSLETTTEQTPEGVVAKEVGVRDLLYSLQNKAPSDVVIDIESDSTIIEDSEQDRAVAAAAISALTEFSNVAPVLTGVIGYQATGELLTAIIQKFKLGRDIQQQVQDHVANIIANPPEPQPSDAEIIAQSEVQKKQLDVQMAMVEMQFKAAMSKAEFQLKQQVNTLKAAEIGVKANIEQQKIDLEGLDKIIKLQALEAKQITGG
jgi:hypothetical protein